MNTFHKFKNNIDGVEFPRRFNNPFYYSPHTLCIQAADELRASLTADEALMAEARKGKMFGVLVVRSSAGEIGYLSAFSGLTISISSRSTSSIRRIDSIDIVSIT